MHHPFMEAIAQRLAANGIATFRYQFPYMQKGRRRPDPGPVLRTTVRAALAAATEAAGGLPLLAGGKSLGGRMTSAAAAESPLAGVRGLVFLGFPLHAAGRPATDRGDHLKGVAAPMLFLQGTRDRLAEPELMRALCARLGERAALHLVDGGDHSFRVPKRSGRTDPEVLDELARVIAQWAARLA